jgi:hypothetical protein
MNGAYTFILTLICNLSIIAEISELPFGRCPQLPQRT